MMNFVIMAHFIMLMIFVIATKIRVKALNFVILGAAKKLYKDNGRQNTER